MREWIYVKVPEGEVSEEHYHLKTSPIPGIEDDEVLLKSLYVSVDPYMRIQQAKGNTWEKPHPLNVRQGSGAVCEVQKVGKNVKNVRVGQVVETYSGWGTHAILKGAHVKPLAPIFAANPSLPRSLAIGALGMPARTAYFGLYELGAPQRGEVVLVSGAAGAVGSVVVQLARERGCRVVAIAGSDEKLRWLREECGAVGGVNYKQHGGDVAALRAAIAAQLPGGAAGIDVFFDNTGGPISDATWPLFNVGARIVICGQISTYNGGLDEPELAPRFLHHVLYKRLKILGVLARDWSHCHAECVDFIGDLIVKGRFKYKETVVEGFERLPAALNSLFHGSNQGKLVVKVCD